MRSNVLKRGWQAVVVVVVVVVAWNVVLFMFIMCQFRDAIDVDAGAGD